MNEMESANIQEVAATETPNPQTDVTQTEPIQQSRDLEKDSAFAKMRREAEQAKKEAESFKKALEKLDFKGEPTEILASVEAYVTGKSLDEVHSSFKERERLERLEQENNILRERETERLFKDHLAKIKAEFPDEKAESVTEIGEEFIKLMSAAEMAGIEFDPVFTYSAIRANKEKQIMKKPPSAGSLKTEGAVESEFFTSEELDRLSKEDLKDPKIFEKAKKSLKRL